MPQVAVDKERPFMTLTRIILSGANGAMGKMISALASSKQNLQIVAGIDPNTKQSDFPIFSSPSECDIAADVIVDFSHPSALKPLTEYAIQRKIPLVAATTGLCEEHMALINQAAQFIPVFFTFNMSLGVNLMQELCKTAARVLGADFDIEIIEKHHHNKIDSPSGTALMLADSIAQEMNTAPVYEYNRQAKREKRTPNEIGIHSVRGGTIVGEHEVIFAGCDEILSITHSASSKAVFAAGALNAAMFLKGKPAGLYSMKDLI